MVPLSLMMRRSGPGVSGATVRPYSLAKARTSLTALGSAACCWRYWVWVRRSLPVRLATLSGALRLTTTETVILAPDGACVSPAAWAAAEGTKGAFSLPGRTARGEAMRLGVVGFFFAVFLVVMRRISEFGWVCGMAVSEWR